MTQGQQPEALQRAGAVAIRLGREGDRHAAETVRAMSARIAELEAQLESIGAGGVEPLRRRECLHQIAEPAAQPAAVWWRQRADEIELEVAQGKSSSMRCYTDMRALLQAAAGPEEEPAPAGEYPALPEPAFRIFWDGGKGCYRVTEPGIGDVQVYTDADMRAYVDADRAMRAQAAPAAVAQSAIAEMRSMAARGAEATEHDLDRFVEMLTGAPTNLLDKSADAAVPTIDERAIAAAVCRLVADLPDRNSPEDFPEAMLVTSEELFDAVVSVIEQAVLAAAPATKAEPALTETAITAKNSAAPFSSFYDSRTQAVYEVLINDNYPPAGSNEHWEGWKARLIVDALFPEAPTAVAGPSEADLPDVEDMAHSALQEALSYGIGHEMLHRWMRAVMDKTVAAMLAAAPTTQAAPAAQGDAEDAARLERERICAAIKAEDDYCVDHGDYMLDSDDCIKIVRGEWVRPDFAIDAARKQGGA